MGAVLAGPESSAFTAGVAALAAGGPAAAGVFGPAAKHALHTG